MQITRMESDNRQRMTDYNFIDFCLNLQKLVKLGWSIEETNEGLPQSFTGNYTCILVRSEQNIKEVQEKQPRGRPPANKGE